MAVMRVEPDDLVSDLARVQFSAVPFVVTLAIEGVPVNTATLMTATRQFPAAVLEANAGAAVPAVPDAWFLVALACWTTDRVTLAHLPARSVREVSEYSARAMGKLG